jgi:hypothetical protein
MAVLAKQKGKSGKPWKIVETATGRVVGESDDQQKAEISGFRRNSH